MLLSHAFLRLPVRRFGAALLFSLLFVLAPVHAATPPRVLNAKSVLVVNQRTGKTLYQKQPNRVLPIASLTKLMTAMVAWTANARWAARSRSPPPIATC